jgi:hypothetical protein
MSNNAPSEALANWARTTAESFIAAQKQWSEIVMKQSAEIIVTVQSGADFTNPDVLGTLQKTAGQSLQAVSQMQDAWIQFAKKQNAEMMKAIRQGLSLGDSSPVSSVADFAENTVNSVLEIQRRWLDMATNLPFLGASKDKK